MCRFTDYVNINSTEEKTYEKEAKRHNYVDDSDDYSIEFWNNCI